MSHIDSSASNKVTALQNKFSEVGQIRSYKIKNIRLNKVNPWYLLKAGTGSAIAIILAEMLGLFFSPSAGIITLLTIQNTKKETLYIAAKRVLSFLMAVIISYILFNVLGYKPWVFGGFILIFTGLSYLSDLKEGISMNAVLMTHFLIEKRMDISLFANEVMLLGIGMGIGIIINMFMPNYRKEISVRQHMLEEEFKKVLRAMARALKDKKACLIQEGLIHELPDEEKAKDTTGNLDYEMSGNKQTGYKSNIVVSGISEKQTGFENGNSVSGISDDEKTEYEGFKESTEKSVKDEYNQNDLESGVLGEEQIIIDFRYLDALLEELLQKAYEDAGNRLLSDTRYLISYLEMRRHQTEVLKDISRNIANIPVLLKQSIPLAGFLDRIADSFHEMNNAKGLLEELKLLYDHYKKNKLPVTREEFEYRAILFQILKQLEYFLLIKRNFVIEIEKKNMKTYWNNKTD